MVVMDDHDISANRVQLRGEFAAEPLLRILPSGDELCSFRVTVRRPPGHRARVDCIDCASTRPAVRRVVGRWRPGAIVEITGSLRRRFWRAAGAGPTSRYEVEVDVLKIAKATKPARKTARD